MKTGVAPRVCVVVHDVAPARWVPCRRVMRALAEVEQRSGRALPLTLLVVPRWHGDARTPTDYVQWLAAQAARGHQLALHGHSHLDEQPVRGWRQRLWRRGFTDGEGEFAALPRDEAARRIDAGLHWARQHDLAFDGFVAPAWLLSAPAWQALDASGFDHTCTYGRIVRLPTHAALPAPALMFSSRSAPRRALSLLRNAGVARWSRQAPLLRLDLHPDDADNGRVRRAWTGWLQRALQERLPVRLTDAARSMA